VYEGESVPEPWEQQWLPEAELDRITALDLSYDPDELGPPHGEPVPRRVLLIDPELPDESPGPAWWARIGSFTPAGYLMDVLDELPFDELDAEQALQASLAAEKIAARAQAIQLKAIARFARLRPPRRGDRCSSWAPNLSRHAPDELGMALSVSRRAAGQRIALAYNLTARLPETWTALHAGRIDVGKARVIADRTGMLADDQAHAVEQRVLARAEQQTHPELKAATDRAAIKVDPEAAMKRRLEQVAQREVRLHPLGDGVSELAARLPTEVAAASYDRLCELATKAKTPDDPRTPDQRRADVFADLLLGNTTGGGTQAQILILTRETSLLRLDDEPGELVGSGPLPAEVVRKIAEQHPKSIWRRLLTDPTSGVVTDLGRTRYRPTAGLDEFVRLRVLQCYFPGCRTPATRCDLDHLQAAARGGDTSAQNLGPICRHHHPLKDGPDAWPVSQPAPGVYEVTTPTGRKYRNQPHPLLGPPEQDQPHPPAPRGQGRPHLPPESPEQDHDPPPF
jgi:Domain of unknown function (DUF222)